MMRHNTSFHRDADIIMGCRATDHVSMSEFVRTPTCSRDLSPCGAGRCAARMGTQTAHAHLHGIECVERFRPSFKSKPWIGESGLGGDVHLYRYSVLVPVLVGRSVGWLVGRSDYSCSIILYVQLYLRGWGGRGGSLGSSLKFTR